MDRTDKQRVVITGIGLTAPNGNSLAEYRANLLAGVSGIVDYDIRYFGKTYAGLCSFDPTKYLELHRSDDPASHIGLRMVMGMTKEAFYINTLGLNNLTLLI